jgi:uncharacterized protein
MDLDGRLHAVVAQQPYPLLFATVSGAHLYGFPSPDSDYDLRGVHLLPLREVVGLDTIEVSRREGGLDLDLVTHEARKFFGLLLKRNGYVLEQLYSPLVVDTTPAHEELKALARGCLTRHHSHHYLGFARTQWRLFEKERPRRVKPLLYVYRVLLTGIRLLRAGEVEANLVRLNEAFRLPQLPDLIARKVAGPERSALDEADVPFHQQEHERLVAEREDSAGRSALPEAPTARAALPDLLVRLRMGGPEKEQEAGRPQAGPPTPPPGVQRSAGGQEAPESALDNKAAPRTPPGGFRGRHGPRRGLPGHAGWRHADAEQVDPAGRGPGGPPPRRLP